MNIKIILLIATGVIALAGLIGHLVVCATWTSIINPTFSNAGGICATLNISAICICLFAAITIVGIIVLIILKFATKNVNKWLLIGIGCVWAITFVCACINFSKMFNPNDDAEKLANNNNFVEFSRQVAKYSLSSTEALKDWREFLKRLTDKYGDKEDDWKKIVFPYTSLLAFLIVEIVGIVVYIITLIFFLKG